MKCFCCNYLQLFLSHDHQTHQINFEYIAKEPFMFVSLFRCAEGYSGDPNVPGRGCTKSKFVRLCFVFFSVGGGAVFICHHKYQHFSKSHSAWNTNFLKLWFNLNSFSCDWLWFKRNCKGWWKIMSVQGRYWICMIPLWQWICMIGCLFKNEL